MNRIEEFRRLATEDCMGVKQLNHIRFAQLIADDCATLLDEDSVVFAELGGYAHDIRQRYGVPTDK
jgi:hypothetical protein